jgi:hypothetical protein
MRDNSQPQSRTNSRLPRRAREAPGGWLVLAVVMLAIGSLPAGCAKAQANAAPEGPPLAVPVAPPRVIAAVEEPPPAETPTPEPAATPPRTTRPAPASPPRRPATGTTESRPETPGGAPATPPAPQPSETAPAPRPAPTAADLANERRVQGILTKAATDLNRVDYRRLSNDGRAQYELAKRFSEQADQALKERNYGYATTLAEKAAALATELLGR